jgi:CheY-like chemotaxis protein
LCVDDEALILHSLVQELRNSFGERFYYERALNAEEAFLVIDDLVEDGISIILIISDWLMPGIKGDEFLAQVAIRHPGIKALMLTGQADETATKRVLESGLVFAVLRKPWDPAELRELIQDNCFEGPKGPDES